MVVDGQIVIRPIMVVALTYDHRLLDGREAVTFLGACLLTSSACVRFADPACFCVPPTCCAPHRFCFAWMQSRCGTTLRTLARCSSPRGHPDCLLPTRLRVWLSSCDPARLSGSRRGRAGVCPTDLSPSVQPMFTSCCNVPNRCDFAIQYFCFGSLYRARRLRPRCILACWRGASWAIRFLTPACGTRPHPGRGGLVSGAGWWFLQDCASIHSVLYAHVRGVTVLTRALHTGTRCLSGDDDEGAPCCFQ